MSTLRLQGIHGKNLPTQSTLQVTASDFGIGGMIGLTERRYKKAFLCQSFAQFQDYFGDNISSSWYANDAVKGFWSNVTGVSASLYFVGHVGCTNGGVVDAVVATKSPVDGSAAATIRLDSAYKTNLDWSASGNRTGYKIINGSRFSTTLTASPSTGDLLITVASVSGIKIGDLIKCTHTGPVYVYKKVTAIDEAAKTVSFGTSFGSSSFVSTDTVDVMGFQIKTYRKSITGIETEVEKELGLVWCTMEPEVTDFYVQNVHAQNKWLMATDLASVSALNLSFPIDVSTVTYLASGANGTDPTGTPNAGFWTTDLSYFDNLPIRFLANPETTLAACNTAMETYVKDLTHNRWDNPIVIANIPSNQSKAQLLTIGQSYQRSDEVDMLIYANWLGVSDPFATSPNASDRIVPNVGHIMGMWIRSIGLQGIHWVMSNPNNPMYGVNSINGDQLLNDQDRTDVANAGINMIQSISGQGVQAKSAYTPSTDTVFQWSNKILMRNYFKISFVDSLTPTVNEPNSFNRIKASASAMENFYYDIWFKGSTGNVPTGETFGQYQKIDGTMSKPEEHFYVQADLINNPLASINAGNRNLDSWFSAASAAASIYVGVGALLLS